MSKFNQRTFTILAASFAMLVLASVATASHPYHVSKSEINWNPKSGNFEVAMCVWPADLEKALRIQTGKPVDLDKVEDLDSLLNSYVSKTFFVRTKIENGKETKNETQEAPRKPAPAISWVGHEKNNKEAWLYFEISGDKQDKNWTIENRIFFELNEDQMNQLQVTINGDLKSFISSAVLPRHGFQTKANVKNVGFKMPKIQTRPVKEETNGKRQGESR